jgi:predicted nuclease of predicted toxin-antitoxin system
MKLLLDANISWKLANKISPIYGECAHADYIGLDVPAKDVDIWNYALENGYTIVTKDNDFMDLMDMYGFPPKVVLIKTGNNSSRELEELLIKIKQKIEELENSDFGLLEIINKK